MKLLRYGNSPRFQEYLESHGFKLKGGALRNQSVPELEELLTRVQICIANKAQTDIVTSGAFVGIGILENITQKPTIKPSLDLQGLSSFLQNNEQFLDALEEIRLLHSIGTALSPYQRILLTFTTACVIVNKSNMAARRDTERLQGMRQEAAKSTPEEVKK